MSLDRSPNLTKTKTLLLLSHVRMMGNRATVLNGDAITHPFIHLEKLIEEFRRHLDVRLLENLQVNQLM